MTTLEEQLDELIALASDAGRLGAEHAAAERARDYALDKRQAGRRARDAGRAYTVAERRLASARSRFLTSHGGPR
jgi:hypothetical protein